jgi:glycosyltransferase involved in cell wall biosynthesis
VKVDDFMNIHVLCITSHSDRPEAETFIGLEKAGVDIEVVCPSSAPHSDRLKQAGVPVTDLTLKGRIDFAAIRLIREKLKKKRYDILHAFNNRAVSNGILASYGIPLKIIAYRGVVGNVSFFDPGSWMTYLNPRVDRIVCVANAVRDHFLSMRFLWLRIPRQKVITIYKGHDLDWYQDQPADLSEFDIPSGAFVVGCVANLRPRKGIDVLIESTKWLPKDAPVHFLLVGNMEGKKLRQQITESPFRANIHLTGFRNDAPVLMASCDVFVLPALKREGLPKGVIEAMAYGTPPIATDSGGSPELVMNNESGLVIPPGDAQAIAESILYMLNNPEKRQEIGSNARERIRTHFRIQDTIKQTLALYKALVAS